MNHIIKDELEPLIMNIGYILKEINRSLSSPFI